MEYQLQELVRLAKAGDAGAMETIIAKTKPLLLSYIKAQRCSFEIAEELFQEGCLEIICCIKDFDESRGVPFLAFLKKRIFYRIKSYLRANRALLSLDQPIIEDETATLADMIADPDVDVAAMGEKAWANQRLYEAINKLTLKQKELIKLHYGCGLSLYSIARQNSQHYQSVLKLKRRALDRLKDILQNNI